MDNIDTVGQFQDVTTHEKSRTYFYYNGRITIKNVTRVCVRPSGSHRLETSSGEKYIIHDGWMAIRINSDAWSF